MQDARGLSTVEDDEIDLRPYIMTVIRHWRLILGLATVAAAVAAAASLAIPASYEAAASIAISNFGVKPAPEAKAWIDLADSDMVLAQVAQELAGKTSTGDLSVPNLRSSIKATAGPDPSIVSLRVSDPDRERAALIATTWSAVFLRNANSTFGLLKDPTDEFESQSKAAREELRQAEEALIALESRNGAQILQAELTAQQNALSNLYASRLPLQTASQQARSLLTRLRLLDPATPASPSEEMAIMLIQANILSTPIQVPLQTGQSPLGAVSVPIQLQPMGGSTPSGRTVAAQLVSVENLIQMIDDRVGEVNRQIAAIQPQVLELQARVEQAQTERAAIAARRDSAREAVRQLDAARVSATVARVSRDAGVGQARVIEEAAAPLEPTSRWTARNALMAAIAGLMAGIAAAFVMEYVKSRKTTQLQPQPSSQG